MFTPCHFALRSYPLRCVVCGIGPCRNPPMRQLVSTLPIVILESPYAGDVARNVTYARRALLDSVRRGEAPMASHLLYTQILDDTISEERELGIAAGLAWRHVATGSVVYTDYGISGGMEYGIQLMQAAGKPVEYRTIGENPNG